jgi:predicted transcriptional regulator
MAQLILSFFRMPVETCCTVVKLYPLIRAIAGKSPATGLGFLAVSCIVYTVLYICFMSEEQILDAILKRLNSFPFGPVEVAVICQNQLNIPGRAYQQYVERLVDDGYARSTDPNNMYHQYMVITGSGQKFISSGGYEAEAKQKKAKKVQQEAKFMLEMEEMQASRDASRIAIQNAKFSKRLSIAAIIISLIALLKDLIVAAFQ